MRGLLVATSLVALSCGAPAYAQTAPAAEEETKNDNGLDEIVVTARKVEENLQNVPLAITAFSGNELRQQSAVSVQEITRLTPNMSVREKGTNSASASFQIRGQFQTDTIGTLDPSVGLYIDGVYWARMIGANADLLDVQAVQIAKGPQGTLFGRNTTGGAVIMTTANPNFDGISGQFEATYGNYDYRVLSGVVNLPLVNDRISIRLAGQVNKRDGYMRNIVDNSYAGSRDRYTLRGKALFNLTDNFSIILSAEYFDLDEAQTPPVAVGFLPGNLTVANSNPNIIAALGAGFVGSGPGGTATAAQIATALAAPRGSYAGLFSLPFNEYASDGNPRFPETPVTIAKAETYSGTATLDTGWGQIKGIIARRVTSNHNVYDLDGLPYRLISSSSEQSFGQWSGEFQVTGKAFGDRLDIAAGVFVFREEGRDYSITDALPLLTPNNPTIQEGFLVNESFSVYAQGTFAITDALRLTAGVRYVLDDKSLESRNRNADIAVPGGFTCIVPVATRPDPSKCSGLFAANYSAMPYTVSLDYRLGADSLVYVKTSKGFRSGGQNLRGGLAGPASYAPFDPETVQDVEVGFKSEFLDNRVRLNVAAFYSDYRNIQKSVVGTAGGRVFTIVQNAARGRVAGGEAELSAVVFDGFRIGATAGILSPKYKEFIDPGTGADRSGEKFDQSPKFTGSLTASYTADLGFGSLLVRGDYSHSSRYSLQQGREPQLTDQKPLNFLDARVALTLRDPQVELAVWGKNLTNQEYINDATIIGGAFPIVTYHGIPRTYGISATFRFGQ